MRIGSKTSLEDIKLVKRLARESDFIEIYYASGIDVAKLPKAVYTMHCPHHDSGVNLALKGKESRIDLVKDSLEIAGKLSCKTAVVHPGVKIKNTSVQNMILNLRELNLFAKTKSITLLLETIPLRGEPADHIISTPEEYRHVLEQTGCGLCLDFSHACHAALSNGADCREYIREFLKFRPNYFHLYNTNLKKEVDVHLPMEDPNGNLDFDFALSVIGKNDMVALELPEPKLKNFLNAKKFLKSKGVIQ